MAPESAGLVEHLSRHVTPRRLRRMRTVLAGRTRWITAVLEEVYQPHNASAVLRSCECFGVQEVHVVEERNEFRVSRDVALGAARWLDVVRWQAGEGAAIGRCCDALAARGYRLVAATPAAGAASVDDFDPCAGPAAVLFGTELEGLTEEALDRCGERVRIPMVGFTESLNLSVSAALVLRELTRRLRLGAADWRLGESEREELLLRWLRGSINGSDEIAARFEAARRRRPPGAGAPHGAGRPA